MKTERRTIPILLWAAALFTAIPMLQAQTAAPLRSYAVSGSENTRYYNATSGWTLSAQTYTGTFDLVSLTEARLTKVYADGTSVVRDLVLHWVVDLNASAQGGMAAELPDPSDPIIERTTYGISLQSDGVRLTISATSKTIAYLTIAGRSDWFQVAYGDFNGFVISPLGTYTISGSELAGKTVSAYTGTLELLSPTAGRLTRITTSGTSTTMNLAFTAPVDLEAASQTVTAAQGDNQPSQLTTYSLTLELTDTLYKVTAVYQTIALKGRTSRTVASGAFTGAQ